MTWRSFWGVVMESTRGSPVITLIATKALTGTPLGKMMKEG